MKDIYFSFVMATYNSERTIEKALHSIRKQDFNQDEIEILVVDGGSTDRTLDIAEMYGAIILNNPQRLPEAAKMIGLKAAKGKYLCIMDSDEEIPKYDMLTKRRNVLAHYPELKCLEIGYSTPKNWDACSHYISAVGDPFSCFVYRTLKDSMEGLIIRKGIYNDSLECYVARYNKSDIKPIGDSGVVMDIEYLNEHYTHLFGEVTTAVLFDKMIEDTEYVGFLKGDVVNHYSNASFKTYLRKLKFRVINSVFDVSGSGYAKKAETNKKLLRRKYIFPFYTASVIFPVIDGIRMCVNYKHPIFLLHPFFCCYVMCEIVIQYSIKLMKKSSSNVNYAK